MVLGFRSTPEASFLLADAAVSAICEGCGPGRVRAHPQRHAAAVEVFVAEARKKHGNEGGELPPHALTSMAALACTLTRRIPLNAETIRSCLLDRLRSMDIAATISVSWTKDFLHSLGLSYKTARGEVSAQGSVGK